jgi:hypothetical protein
LERQNNVKIFGSKKTKRWKQDNPGMREEKQDNPGLREEKQDNPGLREEKQDN